MSRQPQHLLNYVRLKVELRPRLRPVGRQRTLLAHSVRPLEDPVLPRRQPAEDFVSIVSGPTNRRLASMPVSASGETPRGASTASRTSSSQSSSSGANDTRPASSAAAHRTGPASRENFRDASWFSEEPRLQAGSARCSSSAGLHSSATARSCSADPDHQACRIDRRPAPVRKAFRQSAARLDEREEASRRQVHALEGALDQQRDLADQPVIGVFSIIRSTARTCAGSPSVFTTTVPISGSLIEPK